MQIIVPLLRVLVLMHEQHILHRDIKPENIFLTGKQKLKLGDLGLAIRSTEELPFTRSGTLDYMAPEVSHDADSFHCIPKEEYHAPGCLFCLWIHCAITTPAAVGSKQLTDLSNVAFAPQAVAKLCSQGLINDLQFLLL